MHATHSVVTPAQAGVQGERRKAGLLDSRFRGNDAELGATSK
jgi:hypothetical protein